MMNIEKTKNSQLIYKGKIIKVLLDDISIDINGIEVHSKREIVVHNGGVCALVKTKSDRIKFVKQYRYAFKQEVLELPAGKIEIGENPDCTIVREVEEEVGIIPKSIEKMGYLYSSPGFCTEIIHLYYIDDYDEAKIKFDFDEYLEEYEYTYDQALEMIRNGEIVDAKTVCLILKCQDKFI